MDKSNFFERDLSWLRFNHRVLQEAEDPKNPLLERLKFLAIFSSNLDEFFKVRVSEVRQFIRMEKSSRKKFIHKPKKLLKNIHSEVHAQQEIFGEIFYHQIIPELKKDGIQLITDDNFKQQHSAQALAFAEQNLKDLIELKTFETTSSPQIFLKNEALYLVALHNNQSISVVEVPMEFGRFITLEDATFKYSYAFIEDILSFYLKQNFDVAETYAIKLSRDAELYLDDEFSGDLLEKIKASLPQRETGSPMRFLYPKSMPDDLLNRIVAALEISKQDLIPGGRYHNFKDFFGFPEIPNASLYFKEQPPLNHPDLIHKKPYEQVLNNDVLLQFPYQKFDYLTELLSEIIEAKQCKSIRISLYRLAKDSVIAKHLLHAVRKGIRVFAFIETKARFDEANNLYWGEVLEKAGATVRYSYPEIKVHSKILLIETQSEQIAYISTGNFNHKTAKIYGDFALFTSNQNLTKELRLVFEVLEGKLIVPKLKHLLVSPLNTRAHFIQLVDEQIHKAKQQQKALISLKMNSLQDFEMIEKLYEASQAGVEIQLLIRGICGLKPGITGLSENIQVKSIVDRYLEHSRIYSFGQGNEQQMFIGSADWMTRNLDHRIEVLTPIYEDNIKRQLNTFFELQWADNTKSRIIDAVQNNYYYSTSNKSPKVRAQEDYYELLKAKLQ